MSIDIEIGKRIKQRREELDVSQEELAHGRIFRHKKRPESLGNTYTFGLRG